MFKNMLFHMRQEKNDVRSKTLSRSLRDCLSRAYSCSERCVGVSRLEAGALLVWSFHQKFWEWVRWFEYLSRILNFEFLLETVRFGKRHSQPQISFSSKFFKVLPILTNLRETLYQRLILASLVSMIMPSFSSYILWIIFSLDIFLWDLQICY